MCICALQRSKLNYWQFEINKQAMRCLMLFAVSIDVELQKATSGYDINVKLVNLDLRMLEHCRFVDVKFKGWASPLPKALSTRVMHWSSRAGLWIRLCRIRFQTWQRLSSRNILEHGIHPTRVDVNWDFHLLGSINRLPASAEVMAGTLPRSGGG